MSQIQQFKTPQPLVTRHKAWHNEASDSFHEIGDFLSTSRLAGRGWGSSGLIRTSCTPETASPTPFLFAALRKKQQPLTGYNAINKNNTRVLSHRSSLVCFRLNEEPLHGRSGLPRLATTASVLPRLSHVSPCMRACGGLASRSKSRVKPQRAGPSWATSVPGWFRQTKRYLTASAVRHKVTVAGI